MLAWFVGFCSLRLRSVQDAQPNLQFFDVSGVLHLTISTGAEFDRVQEMINNTRSMLLSRSRAELDTWNAFTRRTTRQSLSLF
jgi:hypothetical protein